MKKNIGKHSFKYNFKHDIKHNIKHTIKHTIIFTTLAGICTALLLFLSSYSQDDKEAVPSTPFSQHSAKSQQQINSEEIEFKVNSEEVVQQVEKKLLCKYYNEKDFQQSIDSAQSFEINRKQLTDNQQLTHGDQLTDDDQNPNTSLQEIKGGIVPHHLLAGEMIASFFKAISVEQPDIVVVIAPNHKGTGVKTVHTGSWNWQTPFGILEADENIVNSLIDSKTADSNFDLLEEDHSIAGLVPYIKYYMPGSKIVPVLIHGNYGLKDAQQLGQNLQEKLQNGNKKSLIIASVDFSHYLTLEEADQMDEISIKAIEASDMNMIQHFNNDYIDSPPSIIALLSAMNAVNAEQMKILDHSNSDKIAGARSNETTSYFTVIFYK